MTKKRQHQHHDTAWGVAPLAKNPWFEILKFAGHMYENCKDDLTTYEESSSQEEDNAAWGDGCWRGRQEAYRVMIAEAAARLAEDYGYFIPEEKSSK